jgi:hypothetical protein
MATSYSPKIVTDGLVLCLDAADKKSLLAPPTTNLANNSNSTINWTTNSLVGTRTQSTVSANDYHYRFVLDKGSSSYIAFRFAFDHTNLTNGETYIMSYKYKITSGSGIFYVTDFCDVGVTRVTKDIGDGWYYETAYASRSSYTETYDFFDVRASDDMTVDIKEIQVEHTSASSPLATPFVSYQRQWKDRAGSNNGTLVNMNDQSNFSSEGRGSLIFDGSSDSVSHAHNSNFDMDVSSSIEVLFKCNSALTNSSNARQTIWSNSTSISFGLEIGAFSGCSINSTTGYRFLMHRQGNCFSAVSEANAWVQSETCHFVYTRGASREDKMYVNGLEITPQQTNDYAYAGGSNTCILGSRQSTGGGQKLNGKIYNLKLYTKTLTASEVAQNYNATKGRFGL